MFERLLIECCSPALAGLKTANLFSCTVQNEKELLFQIRYWNERLNARGVFLTILRRWDNKALIYVYRYDRLCADLKKEGVQAFLSKLQYHGSDVPDLLETLRRRIESQRHFPHEIGLFLGYPLEDVIGFIRYGGENFRCTGCWKVYCNECEKKKLFSKFQKCREVYQRMFENGRTVIQLTTAFKVSQEI